MTIGMGPTPGGASEAEKLLEEADNAQKDLSDDYNASSLDYLP